MRLRGTMACMMVIKNSAVFLWVCAVYGRMYPVAEDPIVVRKSAPVARCSPHKHCVNLGSLRNSSRCEKRVVALKSFVLHKRELLFIDGTSFLGQDIVRSWPQAKIVILRGCPLALARTFGRHVFVDYGQRLSAFFLLKYLPARVVIEGNTATIYEGLC